MFRKSVLSNKKQATDKITWRGHEITRIEAFSDAVFAFAVTLLIMSLEVPKNAEELLKALHFIIPFGVCFAITMTIWYNQNIFFRRYGLHDLVTIALNSTLMFLVLVYMFPLKFLIGSVMTREFVFDSKEQLVSIYSMYTGGFACFYFLFSMMYLNAYKKRALLKMTPIESFTTMTSVYSNLIITIVAIIAVVVALQGYINMNYAGFVFFLIWPAMTIFHARRKKIFKESFGSENENITDDLLPEILDPIPDDNAN